MAELRRGSNWLRWVGVGLMFAGALLLIVGGILPWAKFHIFGSEVSIPGLTDWGAVTVVIGVLVLSMRVLHRRMPLLVMVLGLVGMFIALQAQKEMGLKVRGRMLLLENAIAPVNARLAQAALSPLEPFGPSIGRAQDYQGPGPTWTFAGGVGLALGGALAFSGGRLGRSCRSCGTLWRTGRLVLFCPSCGMSTGRANICRQCRSPLENRDRYCVSCGTGTA